MITSKPYVQLDPAIIEQARQMDLLSYLQRYEPSNLKRVVGNVYCTREHDSLKIYNGKWYWWSRGIGGVSFVQLSGQNVVKYSELYCCFLQPYLIRQLYCFFSEFFCVRYV